MKEKSSDFAVLVQNGKYTVYVPIYLHILQCQNNAATSTTPIHPLACEIKISHLRPEGSEILSHLFF